MTKYNPAGTIDRIDKNPARQTDESKGRIKRPQGNEQKNLARGSEPETHAQRGDEFGRRRDRDRDWS